MSFNEEKRNAIIKYMLDKIRSDDVRFIEKTADSFGILETTVRRYINKCTESEDIKENKQSKSGYMLTTEEKEWNIANEGRLEEDKLYVRDIQPFIEELSKNVKDIWSYAFAEMMNNAIEHSKGSHIVYRIRRDRLYTEVTIVDDGIGIFKNICEYMKKQGGMDADISQAILELHKGKMTTLPEHHSGEGIFFVSKLMTGFAIMSDDACFSYNSEDGEKLIRSHLVSYYTKLKKVGTMVVMELANDATITSKEVFDRFAPIDEGFVKTIIPLSSVCTQCAPVARSQARRILRRLDEFKEIFIDFQNIEFMGQGFADEIFRVFQNEHADILITPINANKEIIGMIRHVNPDSPSLRQQGQHLL